jgi:hypothetical protein
VALSSGKSPTSLAATPKIPHIIRLNTSWMEASTVHSKFPVSAC